jgi:phosphoribosylformimino-5-aminoimidazole carboxamide ribotide isomerase
MQILPAVDVLGLDAVRLERGEFDRVLFRRPLHDYITAVVAATNPPLLHLVDLQGARDGAFRSVVLETGRLAAPDTPLQVSGGIRSVSAAQDLLAQGAQRVIVGTAAFESPSSLSEFVDALGDAVVIALDVREGRIATRGWQASSGLTVDEALDRCRAAGVARIHATAIDRDGTMGGPDIALYETICRSGIPVVAAGGVRNQSDIDALEAAGCEAAVMGTALAIQLGVMTN